MNFILPIIQIIISVLLVGAILLQQRGTRIGGSEMTSNSSLGAIDCGFFQNFLRVIVILIIVILLFLFQKVIQGATLNEGTEFVLCTGEVIQPTYTTESYPHVTFHWSFTSSQSSYSSLPPSTQSSFWIEIDDNSDFSSPEAVTGEVSSSNESYSTSTPNLSFNTTYFWRIKVKDSYNSISDWTEGDAFRTNKPSIRLKGGIRIKGGVKFK